MLHASTNYPEKMTLGLDKHTQKTLSTLATANEGRGLVVNQVG